MDELVTAVLIGLAGYAAVGAAFAMVFVSRGVGQLDPNAQGTGIGFRMLIAPGVVALWPVLAARWLRSPDGPHAASNTGTRAHRRVHLVVWLVLGPMLGALIVAAVLTRPAVPAQEPPAEALP